MKRLGLMITAAAAVLVASSAAAEPAVAPPAASFPAPPRAPAGAPNVLLIMTDDVGFAASSTFGGPIPTPTFDALAARGLRYTGFNTAAVCSPTRAALLTGRNPHQVGMGTVPEGASPHPGYNSVMPKTAATVAEVLRANGYSTAMFGKWHLTPAWERSIAGPFDHWPSGMGFDHFYGFLGGEVNQFAPTLIDGHRPIRPTDGDAAYHFDRDLANHAIGWIRDHRAAAPDKPFFIYYATGSAHTPHHAPADWLAKFRGRFDKGWDVERAAIFSRQKALGIVPRDAVLTPRPAGAPAWADLSPDEQVVAARFMEAYAASLAHADHEIGRVLAALQETGALDNTLVIYIQGDNGASGIGGRTGSLNDQLLYDRVAEPFEGVRPRIDEIGGPMAQSEYPYGWAHAMDTPFQHHKSVASHFGGTRNGMVLAWPGHVRRPGEVRTQFHFVSDIYPSLLEAAGIAAPAEVNGVKQQPIEGVSLLYSLNAKDAPTARETQVFEAAQNVAIYHRGWVAGTTPVGGWTGGAPPRDYADRNWELYDLSRDFSQANDLADRNPAKLAELKQLFFSEAKRTQILPMQRFNPAGLAAHTGARTDFVLYPGGVGLPEGASPAIWGRSFRIAADLDVPENGAHGVLAAQGGRFVGVSLYMQPDGRLAYTYNHFGLERATVVSRAPVPAGRHQVEVDFRYDGGGSGKGGLATLKVNGVAVGEGRIARTRTGAFLSVDETFDVGEDSGTPVVESYTAPNRFTGTLREVRVQLR